MQVQQVQQMLVQQEQQVNKIRSKLFFHCQAALALHCMLMSRLLTERVNMDIVDASNVGTAKQARLLFPHKCK